MMRYVVGFVFTHIEDQINVALVIKARPAWQAGYLNGIGGKIEINESPAGAMQREFREETGVDIDRLNWLQFHYERFRSGSEVYFFVSSLEEPANLHNPDPTEPVGWYPMASLLLQSKAPTMYNLPYLVPMALVMLTQPLENVPLEG